MRAYKNRCKRLKTEWPAESLKGKALRYATSSFLFSFPSMAATAWDHRPLRGKENEKSVATSWTYLLSLLSFWGHALRAQSKIEWPTEWKKLSHRHTCYCTCMWTDVWERKKMESASAWINLGQRISL